MACVSLEPRKGRQPGQYYSHAQGSDLPGGTINSSRIPLSLPPGGHAAQIIREADRWTHAWPTVPMGGPSQGGESH